jgi:hypothetical protein
MANTTNMYILTKYFVEYVLETAIECNIMKVWENNWWSWIYPIQYHYTAIESQK